MKINKLALLMSLTSSFAYSITESFSYSRFDIPNSTFDTKIESKGAGAIFTTKNSVYCYQCNGTVTMTSQAVRKILECAQGSCTETVYNAQTGQQIVLEMANVVSITPGTAQESPKSSFKDAINSNRPVVFSLLGAVVIVSGYGLYRLYNWSNQV